MSNHKFFSSDRLSIDIKLLVESIKLANCQSYAKGRLGSAHVSFSNRENLEFLIKKYVDYADCFIHTVQGH